jgi:hypothetical protein
MSEKKTIREVMEHALAVLRASNIRGMEKLPAEVPDLCVKSSVIGFEVTRTFHVRASIHVSFTIVESGERVAARVNVAMPALNDSALRVAASAALLQEMAAVAVTLQVELNEFEIALR